MLCSGTSSHLSIKLRCTHPAIRRSHLPYFKPTNMGKHSREPKEGQRVSQDGCSLATPTAWSKMWVICKDLHIAVELASAR